MLKRKKKGPGSSPGKSDREWQKRIRARADLKIRTTGPNRKGLRCERKVWYNSVLRANTSARDQLRTKGRELFVYFCRHCDGFHLTSQKSNRGPSFLSLNQEILEVFEVLEMRCN